MSWFGSGSNSDSSTGSKNISDSEYESLFTKYQNETIESQNETIIKMLKQLPIVNERCKTVIDSSKYTFPEKQYHCQCLYNDIFTILFQNCGFIEGPTNRTQTHNHLKNILHSEKPSIVKLTNDKLTTLMQNYFVDQRQHKGSLV